MQASYLGLDLGTSALKALLCDVNGAPLASASAGLSVSRPQPGWSEQDPADWWAALVSVCDELARTHPQAMAALAGIGLSGQMHGAVLLDAGGHVLRPAILWNDQRASAQCATLAQACPKGYELVGLAPSPGFTAPKLLWVAQNEPDIFAQTAKVLLPKDYLRYRLSGEFFTDLSDASGTYWLDVARRDWSTPLLEATGLTRSHMPQLCEGSHPAGHLDAHWRARWGIHAKNVPIAGGAGDNAAAACGVGVLRPGSGVLSLGTSGVLFAPTAHFAPNGARAVHSFCHAVPQTWHHMGVVLSAGDSLAWLSSLTGQAATDLAQAAQRVPPSPDNEIFVPYLSGERTPHNDPRARGMFAGLSQASDPARLARAVLEGVTFAFADCGAALAEAGSQPEQWIAVGGGARSSLWLQMLADLLDAEIGQIAGSDHGAALGAARLAMCAATGAAPDDVMHPPPLAQSFVPNSQTKTALRERYAHFKALYPVAAGRPPSAL